MEYPAQTVVHQLVLHPAITATLKVGSTTGSSRSPSFPFALQYAR